MRTLLAILLLMLCWVAQGATNTAANATQAAVQTAIGNSVDGDTVSIPAGNVTWSSTLSITKCIYLIGHGTNTDGSGTVITAGTAPIISWKPHTDLPIRLSSIRFESGGNVSDPGQFAAVRFFGTATLVRVDRCFFNTGDSPCCFNIYNGGTATGWCYGVLDHCTWKDIRRQFVTQSVIADGGLDGTKSWTWPMLPGTTNSVVFENCRFTYGPNTYNNADASIYGQYGARALVRYCSFDGGSFDYIDAHNGYVDTGPSTVLYECYSNTMVHGNNPWNNGSPPGGAADFYLRGGQMIIHGNNSDYNSFVAWTTYYANDFVKLTNCYVWDNTTPDTGQGPECPDSGVCSGNSGLPGVHYNDVGTSGGNVKTEDYVKLNQQFFGHAPQPGQNFYPYTVRADGGWGYLDYPHPLVRAQDGGSSVPAAQLTPSSLAWVMNPGSGSSNKVFTIKNVGGGTLTGYVHFANP